jgi:hypothetical protein
MQQQSQPFDDTQLESPEDNIGPTEEGKGQPLIVFEDDEFIRKWWDAVIYDDDDVELDDDDDDLDDVDDDNDVDTFFRP